MKTLLIAIALISVAYAAELFPQNPVRQCEGSTVITSAEVEDCKNPALCKFQRGRNYTLIIKMKAIKNVKNAKVLVSGLVGETELPFPGLKRYLCKEPENANFCPQEAGKDYTANITLPVLSLFPKIKTTAFIRFIDNDASSEAEEKIACFNMPVELVGDPVFAKKDKNKSDEDDDD